MSLPVALAGDPAPCTSAHSLVAGAEERGFRRFCEVDPVARCQAFWSKAVKPVQGCWRNSQLPAKEGRGSLVTHDTQSPDKKACHGLAFDNICSQAHGPVVEQRNEPAQEIKAMDVVPAHQGRLSLLRIQLKRLLFMFFQNVPQTVSIQHEPADSLHGPLRGMMPAKIRICHHHSMVRNSQRPDGRNKPPGERSALEIDGHPQTIPVRPRFLAPEPHQVGSRQDRYGQPEKGNKQQDNQNSAYAA